ncbi:hypothetical protein ACFO3U_05100 [Flavobacterium ponti]|jgi:hypothetical protein|uniref:Beta-lactamase-inhibitor-like PepSY-like domain-containing protein n=1 Tax=Flavobacterium ponti TaxID=665133 RepID=A0ABV9P5Z4_9FLAO
MKKVFLLSALAFASLTTFATTQVNSIETTTLISQSQEEFKEIKPTDIAQPVKDAIKRDFADATVSNAYVNEKNEYKLVLSIGDDSKTVYADAKGNWLKRE